MPNRRTGASTRITDDELKELVLKLQQLIPESNSRCATRVSSSRILKEACNYINKLHKEVDDLSSRLAHLLNSLDSNSVDVETLRSLLQQ